MYHAIILAMAPAPQYSGNAAPESSIFMFVWLLLVGSLITLAVNSNKKTPTLVLRRFSISKPGSPTLIEICGRDAGPIDWLLTSMKLKDETELRITGDQISFIRASVFGKKHQTIPIQSVASASSGYRSPVGFLLFGVIAILIGLFSRSGTIIAFSVIIAAICVLLYILGKKIIVSIETSGGSDVGISFARSVIENIPVDLDQAQKVVDVINQEITRRHK